ncbi:MAG TPA: 3-oxoadipyl-CoA thiolase [Stenotrophomonas sp.]|nr:3-oxoadipyl-CoA thiolase [Stenotrophomonas sp.]
MPEAYLCDAVRTPFGRYAGSLSGVRADDLAALPISALMARHPEVDWAQLDDVIYGCANQAGEDNRNVARMAVLLAGLPVAVPATTVNRLCGSGLDAVTIAARAIRAGEGDLLIAGGAESMSRAPFVLGKADAAFSRHVHLADTTLGWRFINPLMQAAHGIDSMAQTAENVAREFAVSRVDQDAFACRSQARYAQAQAQGFFAAERLILTKAALPGLADDLEADEPPRPLTTPEALERLRPVTGSDGSITAGNASPLNDGAAAVLLASASGMRRHGLRPRARVVAASAAGVAPRIMGMAPVPAVRAVLDRCGLRLADMDVIEINEAFAAQCLAVARELGLRDDEARLNANGGAIAIGHPLGATGARLVATTLCRLEASGGRYGLCSLCIGVGQALALVIERVSVVP